MAQKRPRLEPGVRDQQASLYNLFETGIPTTSFVRNGLPTSTHYSDHLPVNADSTGNLPFGVLENLDQKLNEAYNLGRNSILLTLLEHRDGTVSYANEAALQGFVRELIRDVISALGHGRDLEVCPEIALTKIKYLGMGGSNCYDFWEVRTATGRPILIIQMNSPSTPKVLDHPRVKGQALDYMSDIMSFFGQYHAFGITTTMEEFRIHWFPHSDEYAASTTIPTVVPDLPALDRGQVVLGRVLHHSPIVRHDDPELMGMLASVVEKCLRSPYSPVGLLDTTRAFIRLTSTGWSWTRLEQSLVDSVSLECDQVTAGATSFVVVKYFFRCVERKIWLAIAEPQGRLVVAKLLSDAAMAEREVDMWRRVNECTSAFTAVIRSVPAVCTPLVIHAFADRTTQRVRFDLDISHWVVQEGATAQPLPPRLAAFQQQVLRLGAGLDPRAIARQAIDRMAGLRLQHDDLAWRHVALLPVFHGGTVTGLKPALIDFGMVTADFEPEQARQVMYEKLQEMEASCVWE